eukprot:364809-Chlamydomonas_euryale.AAC.15
MCRGRRLWPITLAEAKAGLRLSTCMHVNARGWRPRGIFVHACPRPRASRGRGRRNRPRPEAETSIFFCKDDPTKVSHNVNCKDRPLMYTA